MNLIADGLLMATAMIAGLYCLVLSRRLKRLTDSGSGIGSQIAALDRALAETRGALTETRDGVAELRASARSAVADLRRRTEAAESLAARLGEASEKAEGVLQRLYEAQSRVEAHAPMEEGAGGGQPGEEGQGVDADRHAIVLHVDEPGARSGEAAGEAPGSHERGLSRDGAGPADHAPIDGGPEAAEGGAERGSSSDEPGRGGKIRRVPGRKGVGVVS